MRIISGKYKGLYIKGFDIDGTRPTMDRVKESMFAMIQGYLRDSVSLDLFAGSGSLGLEAISNGVSKCYFVDYNSVVQKILKDNLKKVSKESYQVLTVDYQKALLYFREHAIRFDVVFLDPPYHLFYITPVLHYLLEWDLLNEGAIVVCEYEEEKINHTGYDVFKYKKYGMKQVMVLKKS